MLRRCTSKFNIVVLVAALLLVAEETAARPSTSSITIDDCQASVDIRILCQRCAKVTKSIVVYPMCCNNTQGARQWCFSYVSYGKQHIQ
ncbi:uncharacterized protein LOC124166905 [Ischnura elegans]|uniref:uncharacterized protein LOC124166905 n=1 Tax=Ischnura elegans TaxID=197161 RepID=UPI001ED89E7A|nr:uncharacterized protein LOC124166905 [Ischnura elegans]